MSNRVMHCQGAISNSMVCKGLQQSETVENSGTSLDTANNSKHVAASNMPTCPKHLRQSLEQELSGTQHTLQHSERVEAAAHVTTATEQEQHRITKRRKENGDMFSLAKRGTTGGTAGHVTVWPADASSVTITCQYTVPCGLHYACVGDVLCFLHQSSGKLYPLRKGAAMPSTGLRAQLLGLQHDSPQPYTRAHTPTHTHTHTPTSTHTQQNSTYTPVSSTCSTAPGTPQRVEVSRYTGEDRPAAKALAGVAPCGGMQDLPDNVLEHIGGLLIPEDASADDHAEAARTAAALACCGSRATLVLAQGAWGVLDPNSLDVTSCVYDMGGAVPQCTSLHAGPICRPHASPECQKAMERLIQLADPLQCPMRNGRLTALKQHSRQEVPITESVMRYRLSIVELVQVAPSGGCGHRRAAVRRASIAKHGFEKFQMLQVQPQVKISRKRAAELEENYRTLAATVLLAKHQLTIGALPEDFGIRQSLVLWVKTCTGQLSKQTPAQAVELAMQQRTRLLTLKAALAQRGCRLRTDSNLCSAYIKQGHGKPADIAITLEEMRFLHECTKYKAFLEAARYNSEQAKEAALQDYVLSFSSPYAAAEAQSVPESLRGKINSLQLVPKEARHIHFT